ncbi:MAG: TerB family tellurite resistance protein, partial [Deltaproteobacteria bacterium]
MEVARMGILDWLGLGGKGKRPEAGGGTETESVRRIGERLRQLPPERARYLAAFAYLLGRVAHADLDFAPSEIEQMEKILAERASIEPEQAALVVLMAAERNRLFGGTENFLVAREFDQIADSNQKLGLLRCLYAVAAADGSISAVEDAEIGKIASELGIDAATVAATRAEFRSKLAVLK